MLEPRRPGRNIGSLACGPRDFFSPDPPYFRYLEVDGRWGVARGQVEKLWEDGISETAKFPPD